MSVQAVTPTAFNPSYCEVQAGKGGCITHERGQLAEPGKGRQKFVGRKKIRLLHEESKSH